MLSPLSESTSSSTQDELIELGYNWFLHNPNLRAVRMRYEAIASAHPALPTAKAALHNITGVLLQIHGCRATIVPCLHRSASPPPESHCTLGIVLHMTMLNVEVLELVHLMHSAVPVHLYIGDPLAGATPFDMYKPDRLSLPARLEPGDPLFCSATRRAAVLGAYLHPEAAPADGDVYALTVGHAVVPHADFTLHPRLVDKHQHRRDTQLREGASHRRRVRSSQLAVQHLGRPLSSPAPEVVAEAVQSFERERARILAEAQTGGRTERALGALRRLRQQDAECAVLRASLARPHEYEVGHACAAEALVRPCNGSEHRQSTRTPARPSSSTADEHTHLLSWTLVRMTSKTADNPPGLYPYPGTLERGAVVSMHVRDPNLERPLGPYRDGVVNGAPANVIIDGHVAREWAVFSASGRFAARGDAGALITGIERDGQGRQAIPLAMLYAAPERGPYGLVTPLTTILRRIRDVTGMQMRFQANQRG